MRLVLTADFHGRLPDIPPCDVLCIAGDICPDFIRRYRRGDEDRWHHGQPEQMKWLEDTFVWWLANVPASDVVMIAGNHDYVFESAEPRVRDLLSDWVYLRDEPAIVQGVNFYGLPWVPNLPSWAFYGDYAKLTEVYDKVPAETDVLLTHGPPFGYGDLTESNGYGPAEHVGTPQCLSAIQRVAPRITATGHIHEAYGHYRISTPQRVAPLYNVSYNTVRYEPIQQPVEVEL